MGGMRDVGTWADCVPDQATYITPEDPSSEICGEVAAAFASAAIALRDTEPEYAEKLIEHSKQARARPSCSMTPACRQADLPARL